MAWAKVQQTYLAPSGGGSGNATVTGAYSSNVVSGNLLVIMLNSQNGATVTSVKGNRPG